MSLIGQDPANYTCQEFPVPREEECRSQYFASAAWNIMQKLHFFSPGR